MKLCSDKDNECHPICDFCRHYDFDTRWCFNESMRKDPVDSCDDFECYTLKQADEAP